MSDTPEDNHPFEVGMRVVWLSSLLWSDSYEYGTIREIFDQRFETFPERIRTVALIDWDDGRVSSEGVNDPVMDIALADTFSP